MMNVSNQRWTEVEDLWKGSDSTSQAPFDGGELLKEGKPTGDRTRSTTSDHVLPHMEDGLSELQAHQMADKLHVDFKVLPDGRFEFSVTANKKKIVLAQTEGTEQGVKDAEKRITDLAREKTAYLEKTFGIHLSRAGEKAPALDENGLATKKMLTCRAPRIDELYGLELSLNQSKPSYKAQDNLKFYFFNFEDPKGNLAQAIFQEASPKPGIYVYNNSEKLVVGEDDVVTPNGSASSYENLFTHEIAHMGQDKNNSNLVEGRHMGELGWFLAPGKTYKDVDPWFIKGKNNELYRPTVDAGYLHWIRCDKTGAPLDAQGKLVSNEKSAQTLTNEEMRNQALVRPASSYFDNPYEAATEALTNFRVSRERRAALLQESPRMYEYARMADSSEIAALYPGRHLVRTPDGFLVPRSEQALREIALFELEARQNK